MIVLNKFGFIFIHYYLFIVHCLTFLFRADDRHHLLPRRQPARVCPRTSLPGVAALRALPRATDIVALRATNAISYLIFIIIYSLFIV